MNDIQKQLKKMMSDLEKMMVHNSAVIKKSKIDPMDNIEYSIEVLNGRKKLIVEIDLDAALSINNPLTNKGNSYMVATTGGFHEIDGEFSGLLMSVNVTYDKKAYDQRQVEIFQSRFDELNASIAMTNKMIETTSSILSEQEQLKTKSTNSQTQPKAISSIKATELKLAWKNKMSITENTAALSQISKHFESVVQVSNSAKAAQLDLRNTSKLRELGYHTNLSDLKRWEILSEIAIPTLGLEKVTQHLIWLVESRQRMRDGGRNNENAIRIWESDLRKIKNQY